MRQEHAVESLAQQSLDKIGKLEADGQLRREHEKAVDDQFMKLNDKLEKLEQELEKVTKMAGKGPGEAEAKTDAGAKVEEAPADNSKAEEEEKEEGVASAEAVPALVAEAPEEEKKLAAALVRRVMTNVQEKLAQEGVASLAKPAEAPVERVTSFLERTASNLGIAKFFGINSGDEEPATAAPAVPDQGAGVQAPAAAPEEEASTATPAAADEEQLLLLRSSSC